MKILILSDYLPTWGEAPPSRLLHLAREFSIAGHDVRVVGSQTDSPAEIDGVEIVTLPFRAYGGMSQGIFALRKEIRQQIRWCDALIVRGYWIGLWSLLYAVISGVNVRMYDFHGYMYKEQFFEKRFLRSMSTYIMELIILCLSTSILSVSKGVRYDLPQSIRRKSIVVENGIYLENFLGKPSNQQIEDLRKRFDLPIHRPVFAVIANFVPWINTIDVVHAASQVKNIADVMLVGDGPGIAIAKEELLALKAENVHIVGILNNDLVIAMLTGLFYGCLCPYDGNWVNSQKPNYYAARKNKEYLAAGLPIIVSDAPGREGFFSDGKTCLLYRSNDSSDLAEKMKELILDRDLAERIGKNGQKIAEDFTWTRIFRNSGLLSIVEKI